MGSQACNPCTQFLKIFITQWGSLHYDYSYFSLGLLEISHFLFCLDRLPVPDFFLMPVSTGPSAGLFHSAHGSPGGRCISTCQNLSPLLAEGFSGISVSVGHLMDIWVLLDICAHVLVWTCFIYFVCLLKKNLRAEWQGHKRTSCLMFRGTGKLFFQLVSPFCVFSNTVRGLQYTSVPLLPALICLLRLAVLACETVPWLWSSHPRWWWAVSISPGACQPFVYRFFRESSVQVHCSLVWINSCFHYWFVELFAYPGCKSIFMALNVFLLFCGLSSHYLGDILSRKKKRFFIWWRANFFFLHSFLLWASYWTH